MLSRIRSHFTTFLIPALIPLHLPFLEDPHSSGKINYRKQGQHRERGFHQLDGVLGSHGSGNIIIAHCHDHDSHYAVSVIGQIADASQHEPGRDIPLPVSSDGSRKVGRDDQQTCRIEVSQTYGPDVYTRDCGSYE